MSTETNKTTESEEPKKRRTRSPGYPATDLADAIAKAKIVWEKDGKHEVPFSSVAEHWGFAKTSSSTMQFAATLKKFGLFDDVPNKPGTIKLSETAIRIICDEEFESEDRQALIKKAALTPNLYDHLWKKYQGPPPSDATLRSYLLADMDFNQSAVDKVIKDFRSTIEFAKLSANDKVTTADDAKDDDGSAGQNDIRKPLFQQKHVIESLKSPPIPEATTGSPHVTLGALVYREYNFPLPTGMAALKVPFPMTEDDFESLQRTLNNFKDGLVKTELPSVDCKIPGHEEQAEALAAAGLEFSLVNFSYSHDIGFATKIANAHGLKLRLNLNWGLAILKRKEQEKT